MRIAAVSQFTAKEFGVISSSGSFSKTAIHAICLRLTLFKEMPVQQSFALSDSSSDSVTANIQLNLFAF